MEVDTTTYYLSSIISSCHSLITADLSCFEGVWDIGNLAAGCTSLEHIDIRGLDLVNYISTNTFLGDVGALPEKGIVPTTCEIIVGTQADKDYMTTSHSSYTNVKTVAEYEAE